MKKKKIDKKNSRLKKHKATSIQTKNIYKNNFQKPFAPSYPVKSQHIQIEPNNPLLLKLEELFYILYKGNYRQSSILRQLNLNDKYCNYLIKICNILKRFSLLKVANDKIFKLNLKFIKDTKIPKYFLLKITKKNSLGEYLAEYPHFIKNTEKYSIIISNTSLNFIENSYVLTKITKINSKILKADVLLSFPKYTPDIITGLLNITDKKYYLAPLERKYKFNFKILHYQHLTNIHRNALIRGELIHSLNDSYITNIEVISNKDFSRELSLLTAFEFDLQTEFNKDVIDYANSINTIPDISKYINLSNETIITIDGEDAKDLDDAVFVSKISDQPLKYKATVAIADVSSYVKHNSIIDIEAKKRGNSTYLPGLVIPMLPAALSNNWCSLNEGENKATLAVDLIINNEGLVENYKFYKAIINSKARFTYQEIEDALNNKLNNKTKPFLENVILPLYECWKLLNKARIKRNTLEIQSNEYTILFNNNNSVNSIIKKAESTAHKIIEELMIAANVAAADFLQKNNLTNLIIYRVHDKPSSIKLENLSSVLKALSINVSIPKTITTQFFNDLLQKYNKTSIMNILNESILAAQSQAKYSTNNIGHFGLSLKEYCHFTSPIRRYADLIIHRLISNVLDNQNIELDKNELEETANYISLTEKNSTHAEYSAIEKIIAKQFSNQINKTFNATIVNITNAGMFVALEQLGAQGLIPMRTLGNRRLIYSKYNKKIIGLEAKITYKIGQKIIVILKETNILKGLLTFNIEETKTTVI